MKFGHETNFTLMQADRYKSFLLELWKTIFGILQPKLISFLNEILLHHLQIFRFSNGVGILLLECHWQPVRQALYFVKCPKDSFIPNKGLKGVL